MAHGARWPGLPGARSAVPRTVGAIHAARRRPTQRNGPRWPPLVLLQLLGLIGARAPRPPTCDPTLPRPRVHVYDLPAEFRLPPNNWRGPSLLVRRLERSRFLERDGTCADFFLLPHGGGRSTAKTIRMFAHVQAAWPFWNATATAGRAAHIMQLPCDHGPGDCNFNPPLRPGRQPLTALGINPADPQRRVLFFVLNGMQDARSHFLPGTDVRLPTPHHHLCGPLCSYRLPTLRRLSPWARPAGAAREAELARPRPLKFFWAGASRRARDARALLISHHEGRAGWRVVRIGAVRGHAPGVASLRGGLMLWTRARYANRTLAPRPPARRRGARALQDWAHPPERKALAKFLRAANATMPLRDGRPNLALSMSEAEFCGSPLGWDGGDSDRYLPAVLLGCIPIFFSKLESRPLEELLPWDAASLRLDLEDIPRLHEILAALPPARVLAMRRAMAGLWERLLFSSYAPAGGSLGGDLRDFAAPPPGAREAPANVSSYLGEDGSRDAFDGLMAVLRARALGWEREDRLRLVA